MQSISKIQQLLKEEAMEGIIVWSFRLDLTQFGPLTLSGNDLTVRQAPCSVACSSAASKILSGRSQKGFVSGLPAMGDHLHRLV